MTTNRELKSALLDRLGVTPQRLSQRVKKMKHAHGPMTTEDATYAIAHLEGMDLAKYLPPQTVDRVRVLLSKVRSSNPPTSGRRSTSQATRQVVVRIEPEFPKVDTLLSSAIASDEAKMAKLYPKYYVLENSIRIVVGRVLEHKHGTDWWQTKVSCSIREKVSNRRKKEKTQPWHGKRGHHEIFYSDFGDLKRIIHHNWLDFKDLFPSQSWILQKLDELETPRNILAHHNPVSTRDQERIDLYFKDWVDLICDRRNLIP